jgi:hypothetical protein
MVFTTTSWPKYYYAAGLILFMRASRTPKEEEAFQNLESAWQDWFGVDLDFDQGFNQGFLCVLLRRAKLVQCPLVCLGQGHHR